jgi:transposase
MLTLYRIELMKKFVGLVRRHRELLLKGFRSRGLSRGMVEGFNSKMKWTARKAYGFQAFETRKIAFFHTLGRLPQPDFAHRFW